MPSESSLPAPPESSESHPGAAAAGLAALTSATLAQLSEGVIVTDHAGRIHFVNDAAARLHGVSRLDVGVEEYAAAYRLFTEDGRPYPSAELPLARAVLRGETVVDARWRIRRPDGSEILAVGSARPVFGPGGERLGAVLTVRDDGARADAERAERRAARIVEQVGDAHVAFDSELRYVAVNAAAERSMGRPREALLGRTLGEAFPSAVGTEVERQYRRVAAEGVEVRLTHHYVGDGLDAHVEIDAYAVTDDDGEKGPGFGVAVFWRDVTARVRAEEALLGSNAALEARNAQLQEQGMELELANRLLQDNAAELEAANEELQCTTEELAERTSAAERAAAALAESETRLRLAIESAQLGTWSWDVESDAATFDGRVRDIFGFEREDPLLRLEILATRVHAEDRDRVASALASSAEPAGPGRYDAEYRVVRPDGSERWVAASGVMRFEGSDAARRPVSLIGTVMDVTDRRRAAAATAASERQWRTMADAIPTLAWTARADGHIDWYNARWYDYTGTKPADMEGWGWQSVHDSAVLPAVLERWAASIATGRPFEMTFPLRGGDGVFRAFLTRVMPLRDADGRVVRWFGTNTDVDAEHVAREAAFRSAERTSRLQALTAALAGTRTLEEVAAVVVAEVVAATGAKTGTLVARRPGGTDVEIVRHSGLTADVATRYARFPLTAATPAAECIRTGEPVWCESRDGPAGLLERFPVIADVLESLGVSAAATVPLAVAGEVMGAMSFSFADARSFTADDRAFFLALGRQAAQALERARLSEAEHAARAAAEGANRAKTDFLATMSHELRTPLNAIAGYAELLDLGIYGPVSDVQREAISRIQRSQRHLLGLINDVLNYAKLEAGRVEYDQADVSVGEALDAVEPLVAPQLRAKGLRFARDACGDVHAVRADSDKLQQVLVNLLSNAIKFTPPDGAVTMLCENRGDAVCIRVRDTGIGIAAERLEHVFAPFVQIDRRLNAPHEGTGLGLAISRDLARGMGGDLTVESVIGEGSTFTLTLARAAPAASTREP